MYFHLCLLKAKIVELENLSTILGEIYRKNNCGNPQVLGSDLTNLALMFRFHAAPETILQLPPVRIPAIFVIYCSYETQPYVRQC